MNDFLIWFTTGLEHILDWKGYDHILYVIALCVMFSVKEWKKLLILITAFTIGHSLTLAASVLNVVSVKQSYIEILIPLTIIATCILNLIQEPRLDDTRQTSLVSNSHTSWFKKNYVLALCFGFIHGLGFSYLLKSMLGKEENIAFPLLSFNFGLEMGQLIIVASVLLFSVFLSRFTELRKKIIQQIVSLSVCAVAVFLLIERI